MKKVRNYLKKLWYFIWEDNSVWSWIVNVLLAFVIIKFLVYPGLGLVFQTDYPVVAVVSGSMEHRIALDRSNEWSMCGEKYKEKARVSFDAWWATCGPWYEANSEITKSVFETFRFEDGLNTGDIMFLHGVKPGAVKLGDILVYQSTSRADPIIHRTVRIIEENGAYSYQTKGDHNPDSNFDEREIPHDRIIGKAIIRIPYLGYVKIAAMKLVALVRG